MKTVTESVVTGWSRRQEDGMYHAFLHAQTHRQVPSSEFSECTASDELAKLTLVPDGRQPRPRFNLVILDDPVLELPGGFPFGQARPILLKRQDHNFCQGGRLTKTALAPTGDPMVRFVNVQKSYDGKTLVVKNLNLDIAKG